MLFCDVDLSRSTMALSRKESCMPETVRERTTCHLCFLKGKKKRIFIAAFMFALNIVFTVTNTKYYLGVYFVVLLR